MSREGSTGRPTLVEYLSGGLLGNVPLILTVFFLTFLDASYLLSILLLVRVVITTSLVAGAALAAFYVAVGVQSSHIVRVLTVGLVTGGFCFLMNLVFSLFLFQWLPLEDYLRVTAFLVGGLIGAYVRTKRKKVVRRPPPPQGPKQ